MEKLALLIQHRMYDLLNNVPEQLFIGLGQLACIKPDEAPIKGRTEPKRVVAAQLIGWKGPRARYAERDQSGSVLPLRQLTSEQRAIDESLSEVNTYFDTSLILAHPCVPLMEGSRPLSKDSLASFQHGMEDGEALPMLVGLNDPQIRMQYGDHGEKVLVYSSRELGAVEELAA